MPYCTSCGAPYTPGSSCCGRCQAAIEPPPDAYVPPPPAPPVQEPPPLPAPPTPPAYAPPPPTPPMQEPPAPPTPPAYAPPPPTPPMQEPPAPPTPPAYAPPPPTPQSVYPPPTPSATVATPVPPMVKPDPREAVLGTANIWFSILLMNIPIIGWIVCICWAFSKRVNLNRRNLARATLIFLIIQIFIWWGIYSLVSVAVDIMMGGMQTAVNGINDTLSSITDISSMVEAAENGGIESIGNIADALQGAVDMLELLPF